MSDKLVVLGPKVSMHVKMNKYKRIQIYAYMNRCGQFCYPQTAYNKKIKVIILAYGRQHYYKETNKCQLNIRLL